MRVISGKFKGQKILTPQSSLTRPTQDRVKESLFQLLEHRGYLENSAILDLFAGSGALAIESLSRGALSADLIDKSSEANKVIKANVRNLKIMGYVHLWQKDADVYLSQIGKMQNKQYDVIFIDPPYDFSDEKIFQIVKKINDSKLLKTQEGERGIIVIERDSRSLVDVLLSRINQIKNIEKKRYSDTSVFLVDFDNE
ncbi:MAG: 16S rRNA (guanine(966)-N(2))-methyltransferase RsmD [Candidatus Ancillula sp.]|jgi:16S rRNA (guanine(966)-N(2))-methyltransferase RsmD|nr:16S rRNA (guanine(966)-N(2))-methyltransferase RsmD [Candidatus Ancillula sp.]